MSEEATGKPVLTERDRQKANDALLRKLKIGSEMLTTGEAVTDKTIAMAKEAATGGSGKVRGAAKYLLALVDKAKNRELADDQIYITTKTKDGDTRIRQCSRSDYPIWKRRKFTLCDENGDAVKEKEVKPAKPEKDA